MAALSRPSLRSSSRRLLPATDLQHNQSPATKRGDHTRDLSSADHHNQPLKKQRLHSDAFLHTKAIAQSRRGKELLVLRNVTKNSVTQIESLRQPDHVRPRFNGAKSATLNSDPTPEDDCTAVKNVVPIGRLEKRNLRSHDGGSRSKSELALYFPNYDELVSIETKDPGLSPFLYRWLENWLIRYRFSDRTNSDPHCRRTVQIHRSPTTLGTNQASISSRTPNKPPISRPE